MSGEVTSKALRSAEDEEKPCLQKRCLIGPGIRPQYRSWGDIFKERRLRIQASESFILCFLALFFSGLFFNHPVSSFYTEPLPWLPPTPHPPPPTIVRESLGHVTRRGVHPEPMTSAAAWGLFPSHPGNPERNYPSVLDGGGSV